MNRTLPARLAEDGLRELWHRSWKAMARAGPDDWPDVTIRPPLHDDAQRRSVGGLLGRPIRAGTASVGVTLSDLDEVLARAGDGWGLVEVVETVDGALPDRAADQRARRDAIAAVCDHVRTVTGDAVWAEAWIDHLAGGMLTRLHGRGELALVTTAAAILADLPADVVPMPALASAVTGDPKALAGTTLEGLVLRGLAIRHDEPRPRAAADRRALWEAAGVVPDDLASQVLVLGLPVAVDGALGRWLAEAADRGWPFRVTLHQLMRSPLSVIEPRRVHVCENPAVLRAAAERLGTVSAPLVCTEGRPSVACSRLLAALRAGGCELAYHGDFDWPGLRIAAAVLAGADAVPWRMGAEDYRRAVARVTFDRPSLRGAPADSPWDSDLAAAMGEVGEVVYEEEVLDDLLTDLG